VSGHLRQLQDELTSILGSEPAIGPGPEVRMKVQANDLTVVAEWLRHRHQVAFADLFGLDTGDHPEIHVIFALDGEGAWLHLKADLSYEDPGYPSLTPSLPAADWYERQVWDELGIEPRAHPALARLRLPVGWPAKVHPLQRGFKRLFTSDDGGYPAAPELALAPAGVVDYPLGPVRSGVVESGHYTLRTVGEELVDVRLQPFYKHRGVEKMAEGLPLAHLSLVAERISGTSAFAHSLALCQALETAAGVEAPPRARFLRTLLAEIERLYNHLGYQADLCQATGLAVGQAQMDILKERVLRLNAVVAGHRYLFGTNVPGGLARDLGPEALQAVARTVGEVRRELETLEPMLLGSSSHLDRLETTGILRTEDAGAYGAVGPVGRASGIDRDLRRDHPYAAYAEVDFDVPVYKAGDAFCRAKVRLDEMHQSLRIIDQVLDRMPNGPVQVPLSAPIRGTSALGWAESPRGEGIHWILLDEESRVERYRTRPASFANAQVFPLAVPGHNILTDFPIIEQSFGLSFAGCDC